MIIVKLSGGLGNQLFQYALGRHLSLRQGCALKLDLDAFKRFGYGRQYRLDQFQIKAGICSLDDKLKLGVLRRKSVGALVRRTLDFVLPIHRRRYVHEAGLGFDARILRIGGGTYLDGYWCSRHYFEAIADTLRADFQPANPLSPAALGLLADLQSGETVSMHVRRGDLVSNPHTRKRHGVLSRDYYLHTMSLVRERVANPRFLVFSDDPAWCRESFAGLPGVRVPVTCGQLPDYEDLHLMSQCRHHIIANSSFSWWGAWLGRNARRMVVAPENFVASFSEKQRWDYYPADWLLVKGL